MILKLSIAMRCAHCDSLVKADETFIVLGETGSAAHIRCWQ